MKPLHIFLLLFAVFITALSDFLSFALLALPGIGIVLALVVEVSINATMGAGLVVLLIMNGMFHPRLGPLSVIGALIPGVDVLPFWVGLVIAGIMYKTAQEDTPQGAVARVAQRAQNIQRNPTSAVRAIRGIQNDIKPHEQAA